MNEFTIEQVDAAAEAMYRSTTTVPLPWAAIPSGRAFYRGLALEAMCSLGLAVPQEIDWKQYDERMVRP